MEQKYLYRYESRKQSLGGGYDYNGEYIYGSSSYFMHVALDQYLIYRETDKGYWIDYDPCFFQKIPKNFESKSGENFKKSEGNYRFVLKHVEGDKKRFAYDTEEKALEYFIIRKSKYRNILKEMIQDLEDVIRIAKGMKEKLEPGIQWLI